MKQLEELFIQYKHSAPKSIEELPSSGSNRRYFRLTADDGSTIIGVKGTSVEENIAFVKIAEHFLRQGLPVPEVYGMSIRHSTYNKTLAIIFFSN